MIRLFAALCKTLLKKLSDEQIFLKETHEFSYYGRRCPDCGTSGKLVPHGDYSRGLTHRKGIENCDPRVNPLRFMCKSCHRTHALLPDIIIPYSRYSLRFVLEALIAYFDRDRAVREVCTSFGIAISTIYEWKKRMALHKELMLKILISQKTPALDFLRGLFGSDSLTDNLRSFYREYAFSFMQNQSAATKRNHPP